MGGVRHAAEERETLEVALAILWRKRDDGPAILLTQRPEGAHLQGQWEFTGGKVEPGETPKDAARRETREETGVEIAPEDESLQELMTTEHTYPSRSIRFHVFLAEVDAETVVECMDVDAYQWVSAEQLRDWPLPEANGPIVEKVLQHFDAN